jgi:hypothetical protein
MAIISTEKKICFIHINRTGGTTVRVKLSNDIKDFLIVGHEHGTMKECLDIGYTKVLDYYKFCFVRQPYDWLLSLFYSIKTPSNYHSDFKEIDTLSFYDFLIWLQDVGMKRTEDDNLQMYRTQSQFVYVNNKLMMDYVYKFEDLCDDLEMSNLRSVFLRLDLIEPLRIPVLNKSERPMAWLESLSIKEIKLVNKIFEEDFKNFKYFKHD